MKYLLLILFIVSTAFGHEGDEEVTAKFAPRFGGRVTGVVLEEDHNQMGKDHHKKDEGKKHADEHHDEPKYMAEIIVSDSNKVRLYFYDLKMNLISLASFPEKIRGSVKTKNGGRGETLNLIKNEKNFMGDLMPVKKKPYDLEFEFILNKMPLHINFKAMD